MHINKLVLLLSLYIVSFTTMGQDYFPKRKKGKWGFIDTTGGWVIKPKFVAVNKFSEGLAAVQKKNKWGFINPAGKLVIKPKYGYVNNFSDGMAAVLSYKPLQESNKENFLEHKWGFINRNGEIIIPFSYRNTFPFKNGIALAANWGQHEKELFMIDTEGKILSPAFVSRENYNQSLFKIKNLSSNGDNTYKYIKKNGESVTDWYINNFEFKNFPVKVFLPSDIKDDTIAVSAFNSDSEKKLCAMMNEEGKVFTIWFDKIGNFTLGYAPAQFNHLWGIIDDKFKWVVFPKYNNITLLEEGSYQADIDLYSCVLLDEKGNILSEQVDFIELFDSRFHLMSYSQKQSNKIITYKALFDKKGKQRTGWYQNINPFHNGFTRIEEEKKTRFHNDSIGYHNWYNYAVDSTGDVLCFWRAENKINWNKDSIKFNDSILNYLYAPKVNFHLTKDYFKKVYSKDFILNKKKGEITFQGGDFNDGMALVSKKIGVIKKTINGLDFIMDDIRYGYINWLGKLVIKYKYKEAANFADGKAIIAKNNKYGAIDFRGRIIIKPQHQLMGDFGNNLAPVFKDSAWGYVNYKNKLVIKYIYDEALPYKYGYASVKKGKEWAVIDIYGNIVLDFDYRKPPIPISRSKIEVLQKGVGYVIIDI